MDAGPLESETRFTLKVVLRLYFAVPPLLLRLADGFCVGASCGPIYGLMAGKLVMEKWTRLMGRILVFFTWSGIATRAWGRRGASMGQ